VNEFIIERNYLGPDQDLIGKEFFPRTPGIRKALKAMARTRKANVNRIAAGKKPVVGGKKVSLKTFNKKTGAKMTKKKAKKIKAER